MSQRERYLAMGVGVVVGLFGLQYGVNAVSEKIQAKQDQVDAAMEASEELSRTITSGQLASRKLAQLNSKSLPTDQETLVTQYHDWLSQLAQDKGLSDIKIQTPTAPSANNNAFNSYKFVLNGKCPTDKWIELIGMFYDTDYLHSISGLSAKSTDDPRVLQISLDARVLALNSAGEKQEPTGQSSGRLSKSLDEYRQAILNRNPFAPPNNPPKIAGDTKFEIPRGERWSKVLEVKDEENHAVEMELVSTELPDGLSLSGKSLSWTPKENGEFEVVLRASDTGWPSKSTEQKLVFKIVDPPKPAEPKPEPQKFDAATQAFVSAIVGGRDGRQAWIRSRVEGKTIKLNEGADLEIGSVKAKVVSINLKDDFVEFESDGAHWTVGMDLSLADAFAKSKVD